MPELWPAAWPLQWAQPLWLAGLVLVPLIWWLHRFAGEGPQLPVASLSLWRGAAAATDVAARRAYRADPAWRRRALIAALLVAALAQPQWIRGEAPLTIWVDNSVSVFTVENGSRRLDALLAQARRATGAGRAVTWRTLDAPSAPASPEAIDPAVTLAPPVPALMQASQEHWLLTDGASEVVQRWTRRAGLSRIITAGFASGNSAITRLSARTNIAQAGEKPAWTVAVTVHNAGPDTADRTLTLAADGGTIASVPLALPADGRITRHFDIDATVTEVTARLSPADSLRFDDVATLDRGSLQLPAVAVTGRCPNEVLAVLDAHPGVRRTAGSTADLDIHCGDSPPPGDTPAVWFFSNDAGSVPVVAAAWTPFTEYAAHVPFEHLRMRAYPLPDAGPALLVAGARVLAAYVDDAGTRLVTGLDPEDDALAASPWWPVLFAALLDSVSGRELLGREATVSTVTSADIAPKPLPQVASPAAHGTTSLTQWLLIAAAMLLVVDWVRLAPPRAWHAWARLAAAALLVVGFIAPMLLAPRAPADVIVLLDASHSRSAAQRAAGWQAAKTQLAGARSDTGLSVLRFGRATVPEHLWVPVAGDTAARWLESGQPPSSQPLDASASNLAAALEAALQLARPGRTTEVLIDSDGAWTGADPAPVLSQLRKAGIGVNWLSESARDMPLVIEQLQGPQVTAAGATVRFTAALEKDRGAASARWLLDGVVVAEQSLAVDAATLRLTNSFTGIAAGPRQLTLALFQGGHTVARHAVVNVHGGAPLLYVGAGDALPAALASTGRTVTLGSIDTLVADLAYNNGAIVVLDDVPASLLDPGTQLALADHVSRRGGGLVLLYGPDTLAVDAPSPVAKLSPVIPGRDARQPPLALQFVLDASGSMVWGPEGASRFALARRALVNSAAQLAPGDSMGLITFADKTAEPLPLARHADPLAALAAFKSAGARGGTVLEPALRLGVKRLAASPAEQRLLVLITDGFVEGERLVALRPDIAQAGIDVLAMAVGDAPDIASLLPLTTLNNGRLMRVSEVAELPRLLPDAVARHSRLPVTGPIAPIARATDAGGAAWPPLAAHVPATLAPGATALLESGDGQPLVAHAGRGAGNVLAFTGGLGEWAPQWQAWQDLAERLDILFRRVDAVAGAAGVHTQVNAGDEATRIIVDLQTADGGWRSVDTVKAVLFGPDDSVHTLSLVETMPGRFTSTLPVRAPGRYLLELDAGEQTVRHAFYHDRATDPAASARTAQALARLTSDGLLDTPAQRTRDPSAAPWLRHLLALAALALYLSALIIGFRPAVFGHTVSIRRESPHATGLQH